MTGDGGTSLALERGQATVHHTGVAVAGNGGKANAQGQGSLAVVMNQASAGSALIGDKAKEQSLIVIRYRDPADKRLKFKIGVVGNACDVVDVQDGLAENTRYRLNDDFDLIPNYE